MWNPDAIDRRAAIACIGAGVLADQDRGHGLRAFHDRFPGKPGHPMDLAFAAESLKPIPKDHILARKAADIEGLRQLAAIIIWNWSSWC